MIAGIICVNKDVCDFGTAYKYSMFAGTFLTILILGYSRFAGAFRWFSELVPESDWQDTKYVNPMIFVSGTGWIVLVVVAPVVEVVLLPVDIIVTIILSIYDVIEYNTRRYAEPNASSESPHIPEKSGKASSKTVKKKNNKFYIKQLSDLKRKDLRTLYNIVEKTAKVRLNKLKKKTCKYLGNIGQVQSNGDYHLHFVYEVEYIEEKEPKHIVFALYFENVYKKKNGKIYFEGDAEPMFAPFWDVMLVVDGEALHGAYTITSEMYCSRLAKEGEFESNFIEYKQLMR